MDLKKLKEDLLNGKRRALAKAITLIESKNEKHKKYAKELLEGILPYTGNSIRIGISGVPGVGKSTFIEAFGLYLIEKGHKVAVLAVDPSSQITGGSVLGDKTRMEELSRRQEAFIRPSPSGDSLGGVARRSRESIFLCEAAGYDVIIIETVGVGQSEISVASMVDMFLLMQLPNAGDELQGIKRGIMEVADAIIINKADSDNLKVAELAKKQLENALSILKKQDKDWQTPVILVSALEKRGIDVVFSTIEKYVRIKKLNGTFFEKRKRQAVDWMWSVVMEGLKALLDNNQKVASVAKDMEKAVVNQVTTPSLAAEYILNRFKETLCEGGVPWRS
ncbi:methylmalonyl Co-A mutase-associated GTPase MeaB [Hippea maritima]|uniref:LAO/AO transport system ATPase n=1 Tax=Hippea maritima (strain ATCC 700847 / DSM 10411 / MH2) TaxID=760142 RepID=F2LW87_HIPMA|nr:methylmalonyl Co-A mutase-associated GTPase MeaB [Hippea maritima]AEA34021.1 LAO/AO transport system ATPase [Hippea maritima DSM 10411]